MLFDSFFLTWGLFQGKYSSHLSETTHEGMDICLMSSVLNKPKYASVIENYFNKAVKDLNIEE